MKKFLRILLIYIPLGLIALSVLWVFVLKWVPVLRTPLMDVRKIENWEDKSFKTQYKWVPLEQVSENMMMAVMASEDTRFLSHNGFDKVEIHNAIEEMKSGKRKRGASTISQQTAKNVFLFPSRTMLRKGVEAYFTVLIEKIWGKRRILEVYLNVMETGKGVYGVQAAAQYYFKTDASKLNVQQSALIAASLPNPLKRNPAHPSSYMYRRAGQIKSLIYKIPRPEWDEDKK